MFFGSQQKVLWLDVSMANIFLVAIVDGVNDRLGSFSGFELRELLLLQDLVEEFSSVHQFHDKAPVPLILKDIYELDNAWMIHLLQNINFSLHGSLVFITHLLL